MKIIFDYNRTLFNPDAGKLFPDVFRVVKKLAQRHELFLVTLDKPERKTSAAIADLQPYFQEVLFVERKTTTVFQRISGQEKKVVVIGDRLEDEIRIGNQLGLITIHLQQTAERLDKKIQPTHRVSSLKKIMAIIETYES